MSAEPTIRVIDTLEELEGCVELQKQIWGFGDRDLVPRRMFVVASRMTGGQVLGAFDTGRLVGMSLAIPGIRKGKPYWHSHMLAVIPEFRNQGLGRRLKLRQREEALAQGIELMEWTFDPLEIKNGYFNLTVLGAVARRYYPDLYGRTSSALQAGLPTDRMVAEWWLRSPRVSPAGSNGSTPETAAEAEVTVPAEIVAWKAAGDPRAAEVQRQNRDKLVAAFASGLVAVGYRMGREGGAFLLGRGGAA